MKRILCFGDSNTYGLKPEGSGRYDEQIRWTARVASRLGENYQIIEEGLCGRTTIFQDELRPNRRGVDMVGALVESHNPIDVLVVMLGTNDCKARYKATAGIIARGMEQVVEQALAKSVNDTKVLIISPILLGQGVGEKGYDVEFDKRSELESAALAEEYEKLAKRRGFYYLDASKFAEPSTIDREHLDETGHEKLAEAIYKKLHEIIAKEFENNLQ